MSIANFKLTTKPEFANVRTWDMENRPKNGPLSFSDEHGFTGFDADFYSVTATESHVGCVVETGVDYDVRIMSDVWTNFAFAIVWDADTNTYTKVRTNDLHAPYCSLSVVVLDASDERLEHYAAWKEGTSAGHAYRNAIGEHNRKQFTKIAEAKRPAKGKRVEVYKGRKHPVGTTGLVFWEGHSYGKDQVGVATSARKSAKGGWADVIWIAADNCKVIDA